MNPAMVRNERRKESLLWKRGKRQTANQQQSRYCRRTPMLDGLIYAATVNRGQKIRDSANTNPQPDRLRLIIPRIIRQTDSPAFPPA